MKIKAEVDEPLCKRITMKLTFFFFFYNKVGEINIWGVHEFKPSSSGKEILVVALSYKSLA